MIDNRLNDSLIQMGYQKMEANTPGIVVYYQAWTYEVNVICTMYTINGDELTPQQYEHILAQIKDHFGRSYPLRIQLLSLVVTKQPDTAKRLFSDSNRDSHWILDLTAARLMVYETQSGDFTAVRDSIENILEEETRAIQLRKPAEVSPFTLFNTGIVIINILAFLLVQFTPVFGGGDQAFLNGALSWYEVLEKKQIYRLITSMFMHANISHLLNNMFVMLFIGAYLERAIGRSKYLFIYFGAGILAGFTSIGYNMWKDIGLLGFGHTNIIGSSVMAVGASGAIFGLVGALLYIVIVNKGRLEQISTRQIVIFIALSLYSGVVNVQIDQAAHIGGFLGGMLLALIVYRRSKHQPEGRN